MITEWHYTNHGNFRDYVKKYIVKNKYNTIDIGASARYWSYPECKVIADAYPVNEQDILFFNINIESIETFNPILSHIENIGKFDFSICSHTLEDVFNPIDLIQMLTKISKRGYIAVPSKYNELTKLFDNKYRGDAHHKQFFDIIDNTLTLFPKFNWIETDARSDELLQKYKGNELVLFWENDIPFEIFGKGKPFHGDDTLINSYYKALLS